MSLFIYNTLTRTKEEFKSIHEGHVGIYVCGPPCIVIPTLDMQKVIFRSMLLFDTCAILAIMYYTFRILQM